MVGVVFGAPGLVAKLVSPETQAAERVLSATGFCTSLLNPSGASLCPSMGVIFDATSLIAETQRQDPDYVKMILRLCKLGTSLVDLFGGQLPPQVGATVKVGAWLWDFSREDIVQDLLGTVRGAEVQSGERISGKREKPDS
jgi:hypothetical protein